MTSIDYNFCLTMTFNCNKLQNKLLNANNLYISYIEVKTKNEWHDYEDLLII